MAPPDSSPKCVFGVLWIASIFYPIRSNRSNSEEAMRCPNHAPIVRLPMFLVESTCKHNTLNIHRSESRWRATPKRWRLVFGAMISQYIGVAPSIFPGARNLWWNFVEKHVPLQYILVVAHLICNTSHPSIRLSYHLQKPPKKEFLRELRIAPGFFESHGRATDQRWEIFKNPSP